MREGKIIKKHQKELTDVEGGGMMVYLDHNTCDELDLDEESTVDIVKLAKEGNLEVEIRATCQGVGIEDLKEFTDDRSQWDVTDHYNDENEEFLSIRDESGISIFLDNNYHLEDKLINNLTIETPKIKITDRPDRYRSLKSLCEGTPVYITISDTKGLWQKVSSDRAGVSLDEVEETLVQISNQSELSVAFKFSTNSTQVSIEDIEDIVSLEQELYHSAKK